MSTKLYGLEIRYNANEPLYCFSSKRAGVGATLYPVGDGSLELGILKKTSEKYSTYRLRQVLPGDTLSFTYLTRNHAQPSNIKELERLSRAGKIPKLRPGHRIGLDAHLKSGKAVRVSHPVSGVFQFILGNVPLRHARVQFMAGNQTEQWHWQFPDLYPGEAILLKVVETDWNDPAPPLDTDPFVHAVLDNQSEAVIAGLKSGRDPNAPDRFGWIPLHRAASCNAAAVAKILVDAGSSLTARGTDGWMPLHLAAVSGSADVVELLINAGADVNARSKAGDTPLHLCITSRNERAARMLLEAGANPKLLNKKRISPLAKAKEKGCTSIRKLLKFR